MTTATHNYGWLMPDPGGSANTWGNTLNGTTQAIDASMWSINAQVTANTFSIQRGPDGGAYGEILFQNNGGAQSRWQLGETSEAESGGNAGSNFILNAFDDSGAYLGNAFEITRANQTATFARAVNVGGALGVGGNVAVSGTVFAGAGIYPANPAAADWYLAPTSGYRLHNWAANWADRWNTANGTRDWIGPSGDLMVLDGGGSLTVTGDITGLNGGIHIRAPSSGNANLWLARNDGANLGVVYYVVASNTLSLLNEIGNGAVTLDGVANFSINGQAFKPGGGAWVATSDARIKTVTGAYSAGLEQVAKLNPVRFVYKGNDGDPHALVAKSRKEFVGLVADEAMQAMPEMVTLGEGYVDGAKVTDLKTLDTTALLYALVNAVKELKTEIEALKAAR